MSLTAYLEKQLVDLLEEKRLVVWYDGEQAFDEVARAFAAPTPPWFSPESPGTGKVRTPSGLEKGLKESLNRAVSYLQTARDKLGLTPVLAQKDICAEAVDLSGARLEVFMRGGVLRGYHRRAPQIQRAEQAGAAALLLGADAS